MKKHNLTVEQTALARNAMPGRYVAPAQPVDVVRRVVQPLDMPAGPVIKSDTTAVDRAQAFVIETNRLSVIVGGLAVLVSWLGLGNPLWTTSILLVFFMWYSLVWLAVWLVHRFLTPEALAWFHAVMAWLWLWRVR